MKKKGSFEIGIINWVIVEILIVRLIYKCFWIMEKVFKFSGIKIR